MESATPRWLAPFLLFDRWLGNLETAVVAALMGTMLILGGLQIALWNLLHQGMPWADPLLRHLVLWVAMIGGSLATRARRHLNMDALQRFLPPSYKRVARVLLHLTSALVVMTLAWVSLLFVQQEMQSGNPAGFLGLARWQTQTILPLAFLAMAWRFLLAAVESGLELDPIETDPR